MRIVVPSRARPKNIPPILRLFPDAIICVGESELDRYKQEAPDANFLTHPDEVTGIGRLRAWILNNLQDEVVVMVDDDVSELYILTGISKRSTTDPDVIRQVLHTTAVAAKDAGASIFGWNQSWDVRKYNATKPFLLRSWVGGVVGVIGRRIMPNENLKMRCDIDFCLKAMKLDRIIWVDHRFSFVQKRFTNSGGNAVSRSSAVNEAEIAYLKSKWGKVVRVRKLETTTEISLNTK